MHRLLILALPLMTWLIAGRAFPNEAGPAEIRAAVNKSLPLLQRIGPKFTEQTGCVSCHHNSLPAMAIGLARERGFGVDHGLARANAEATLQAGIKVREKMLGQEILRAGMDFVNLPLTGSYVLLGLAAENQLSDQTTDAIVHHLIGEQTVDGRWGGRANRPPLEYSDVTATALTIRALQLYSPKGRMVETRECIDRAKRWLVGREASSNEESAFRLMGLGWSGASKQDIQKSVRALLANQRKDGGWSQLPTLPSDAYATGQTLVALHTAGGVTVNDSAYKLGVRFLLNTQHEDGSWRVASRSLPTQRYFESGFPHGKDQWISAAGTSWATMALTLMIHPEKSKRTNWLEARL